jgi:hypothetical protein
VAKTKHAVELHADLNSAQFMVGDKLVELDDKNRVYEARDETEQAVLLAMPFLKAVKGG